MVTLSSLPVTAVVAVRGHSWSRSLSVHKSHAKVSPLRAADQPLRRQARGALGGASSRSAGSAQGSQAGCLCHCRTLVPCESRTQMRARCSGTGFQPVSGSGKASCSCDRGRTGRGGSRAKTAGTARCNSPQRGGGIPAHCFVARHYGSLKTASLYDQKAIERVVVRDG